MDETSTLGQDERADRSVDRMADETQVGREPHYDVVWPQSPLGVQRRPHAPRLADLRGRRVAFVWEYMFRGDELFPVLERHLRDTYDVEVIGYEVFGNTHGPDEAAVLADLPQKLLDWRADAAVSGVGC